MLGALLTVAVGVVMLMACVSDVRGLRIPNLYVALIFAAFFPAFIFAPEAFGTWWEHLGAMLVFLVITYLMFVWNMLGAGDAKYGAALALWVGLQGLMPFVLYMAIVGGVLGVMSLVLRKYKPVKNPRAGSWAATVQDGGNAVPYGIAISVGACAAIFHTGFAFHQLDELIKIIH